VLPSPPRHPERLAFLGTPAIAVPPLRALVASGRRVELVVSRPDTRRRRRGHDEPSPVKAAALELGLTVTDDIDELAAVAPDMAVVAAYGRIIPKRLLERVPMVNIHYSLLPRWRGAAPVERAILAGDRETGVCLMAVEEGLDTGGVHACRTVEIGAHEYAEELRDRLVDASVELLLQTLAHGIGPAQPQVGTPTYADKIEPADLLLDWSRSAVEVERVVRVGGAWTTFHGHRLKVWRARARADAEHALAPGQLDGVLIGTGQGLLELQEVQPEGKARRDAEAWVLGARPRPGDRLGS
jgi:methionyl-tRNA formyltransferase